MDIRSRRTVEIKVNKICALYSIVFTCVSLLGEKRCNRKLRCEWCDAYDARWSLTTIITCVYFRARPAYALLLISFSFNFELELLSIPWAIVKAGIPGTIHHIVCNQANEGNANVKKWWPSFCFKRNSYAALVDFHLFPWNCTRLLSDRRQFSHRNDEIDHFMRKYSAHCGVCVCVYTRNNTSVFPVVAIVIIEQ